MAEIKVVKFQEADFQGFPDDSVVFRFPKMSVTVFRSGGKIFGEILRGKKRQTFEGQLEDPKEEIQAAVDKVMAQLNQVVTITKMDK